VNGPADRRSDTLIAIALCLAAIALRAVLPTFVGIEMHDSPLDITGETENLYRTALREHFFNYLWYNHTLPLMFTVKEALL
jgi:hypothetical protein